MHQSPQSAGRKSRAYSTAAPYMIPVEMIDQSKYLGTVSHRKKLFEESKVSVVGQHFFQTKYVGGSEIDTSRYELRPSLKPKISNKLHLQLPFQEKASVKRYVGQEKQFEQTVTGLFSKLFKSCIKPQPEEDYKQCDYCQHRYYKQEDKMEQAQRKEQLKQLSQPYISYRRLAERQKQPIQVFYQEITNQKIISNRYGDNIQAFRKIGQS